MFLRKIGHETASRPRGRYSWSGLTVRIDRIHPFSNLAERPTDKESSFCIAPLDVVKIRLQLQIHSLSDPSSIHGLKGPVYKGTLPTMRAIIREEGLTVRLIRLYVRNCWKQIDCEMA